MYTLSIAILLDASVIRSSMFGYFIIADMFYNGNPQLEPGAVVCRVARSFVRFGSFQLPVSRGDDETKLAKEVRRPIAYDTVL